MTLGGPIIIMFHILLSVYYDLMSQCLCCLFYRLYNKESALEFLIDRTKFECAPSFEHLRGLKVSESNLYFYAC